MKNYSKNYIPTENYERAKAKETAEAIALCPMYRQLKTNKKAKSFKSKYHRKAYNHLTKSIMRLNQIAMEDWKE